MAIEGRTELRNVPGSFSCEECKTDQVQCGRYADGWNSVEERPLMAALKAPINETGFSP